MVDLCLVPNVSTGAWTECEHMLTLGKSIYEAPLYNPMLV